MQQRCKLLSVYLPRPKVAVQCLSSSFLSRVTPTLNCSYHVVGYRHPTGRYRRPTGKCVPSLTWFTTSTDSNRGLLLVDPERANALAMLSNSGSPFGWQEDITGRNAITKTFHFVDFAQAWKWMNHVANLAETMEHHPEWTNVYNTVNVTLTTHDCGGVSQLDIAMATKMDAIADEILPTSKTT